MIPTLIALGLVFGRWWQPTLIATAVGWPVLLVLTDVMNVEAGLAGAAGLAVINAGVGVMAHQSVLRTLRHLRHASGRTS